VIQKLCYTAAVSIQLQCNTVPVTPYSEFYDGDSFCGPTLLGCNIYAS